MARLGHRRRPAFAILDALRAPSNAFEVALNAVGMLRGTAKRDCRSYLALAWGNFLTSPGVISLTLRSA